MGLTVDSIGQQVSNQTTTAPALLSPAESNDMELSSLLSGSGDFKATSADKIGKYLTETKAETAKNSSQKAGDFILDCLPSVLGAGAGFKLTGSKVILITCLVSNLVALGIKLLRNKKAATANA